MHTQIPTIGVLPMQLLMTLVKTYHYIWPNARAEAAAISRAGADHVLGMPSLI